MTTPPPTAEPALPGQNPADPAPGSCAAPEFIAWAAGHQKEQRLHEAELAQITAHPDPDGEQDAIGQQQAWARRLEQQKRLHESTIADMRNG